MSSKHKQTQATDHSKVPHWYVPRKYENLIVASILTSLALTIITALHLLGYVNFVADVYPVAKLGYKQNTLGCDYAGRKLQVSVDLYNNVDTYYHNNRDKKTYVSNGDFSKFVYVNKSDPTIKVLADQIKVEAAKNGLNNDQTLELATCFVQNIPYNEERANRVLTKGNSTYYQDEQFPYETLFKNSGICTDKTYLGSAILRELGYGTGILIFPDKSHMALGIEVPNGFADFNSKYSMMELTNTGFAPGSIPSEIDSNSGKPSLTLNKLSELTEKDDPTKINLDVSKTIAAPTLVIDVNNGSYYTRIVAVKNLESKILGEISALSQKKTSLISSYNELTRRDTAQESAYSYYMSLPSTTLDCGYKYNYNYSYLYSSPYSSPYTYRCDTVTNFSKSLAYTSYLASLGSYNNQVAFHNNLVKDYNATIASIKSDLDSYLQYSYN